LVGYVYVKAEPLITKKKLDSFSDLLKKFPSIWWASVKIYGFKSFDPNKFRYRSSASTFVSGFPTGSSYEIVFDAQCLQTQSLRRGIGRYSLRFIEAICNSQPNESFAAVLTAVASPKDLTDARLALEDLNCQNLEIIILDPFKGSQKISIFDAQQNLLTDFEDIKCSCFIALSSFQKPESVVAVDLSKSAKYKRIAIFYDLIPLQFPEYMLISNWQKTAYGWALNNLENFDLLLSISNESRQHWLDLISSETLIKVIHGGVELKNTNLQKKFEQRSGVLCVGAEQPHKNVALLIDAYSRLPTELQLEHDLIIVGITSFAVRKRLLKIARAAIGKVEITRYLDESALSAVYENARLLVMPSLVEGLSLPILEAWSYGLPAIEGSNTVAEELIANDLLLFDPRNSLSMRDCMAKFLESEENWGRGLEISLSRASIFTWSQTANITLEAIGSLNNE
jgi:glycosyltransferase involved in cell wall biosynthesis